MKQWQKDYLKQYAYCLGVVACVVGIFPALLLVSLIALPMPYSMGLEGATACLMLYGAWRMGSKAEELA